MTCIGAASWLAKIDARGEKLAGPFDTLPPDGCRDYFSSTSMKANAKALALITSCSTPALRK
jgi:hypothetical protein